MVPLLVLLFSPLFRLSPHPGQGLWLGLCSVSPDGPSAGLRHGRHSVIKLTNENGKNGNEENLRTAGARNYSL